MEEEDDDEDNEEDIVGGVNPEGAQGQEPVQGADGHDEGEEGGEEEEEEYDEQAAQERAAARDEKIRRGMDALVKILGAVGDFFPHMCSSSKSKPLGFFLDIGLRNYRVYGDSAATCSINVGPVLLSVVDRMTFVDLVTTRLVFFSYNSGFFD